MHQTKDNALATYFRNWDQFDTLFTSAAYKLGRGFDMCIQKETQ